MTITQEDHLKTIKWVYKVIADFDRNYYKEDKNRVVKSLDLLSTIKDSCHMNIHPDLYK
tara:strand:+ start:28761 stop:28937 length:177 start_codon:yes stop_codon:yes gene_type:complete